VVVVVVVVVVLRCLELDPMQRHRVAAVVLDDGREGGSKGQSDDGASPCEEGPGDWLAGSLALVAQSLASSSITAGRVRRCRLHPMHAS